MPPRLPLGRTFLALLFLLLGLAAWGKPSSAHAASGVVAPEVRDRVLHEGRARVIAEMRLPGAHVAEGLLSGAAVNVQRSDIASVRQQLLARLATRDHRILHQYETVPFLALDIGPDALAELEASSLWVTRVVADTVKVAALPQSVPLIGADQAWTHGADGTGIVVAIIDTGVDKSHPFLANKVVEEACYSSVVSGHSTSVCPNGQSQQIGAGAGVPCALGGCWHGTHVAGIAAGNGGQAGQTFSGVAKGASIIAIQVFAQFNSSQDCGGTAPCLMAWTSDIIAGLEHVYTLRGQYQIASANLSLGGGLFSSNCDSEPEKAIIDNLRSVGIATVIAAGNDGSTNSISSPACISSAVSVGSTTKGDVISSFSNAAPFMSVFAPGQSITSSYPGGSYAVASGTSMATPHVTGAFAVLRQAAPNATVSDILTALEQTGLPISDTRSGGTVTKPRIQLFQALQALTAASGSNPLPALSSLSPSSATAGGPSFTLTVNGSNFVSSSVIQWNGVTRNTTYVSSGQLQMTVSPNDIATPGSATVSVVTPQPGGGTSNTLSLAIGTPAAFTLGVTKVGSGTVSSSPAGISCGPTCGATYQSGQQISLQATPAAGFTFAGWGGACSGTATTCVVTMSANTAVTATFNTTFKLTVTPPRRGSGTVTSTPAGINCGSTCSARYGNGQQVVLTATPAMNWKFVGWSGTCSGTGNCTVTMTADRKVAAIFSRR